MAAGCSTFKVSPRLSVLCFRREGNPDPYFVVREFDTKVIRSPSQHKKGRGPSEQAIRASIRQAILNMNLKSERATKLEIRQLKAQGILGKRAPSCSLLCADDMLRLLEAFGKHSHARELRIALKKDTNFSPLPMKPEEIRPRKRRHRSSNSSKLKRVKSDTARLDALIAVLQQHEHRNSLAMYRNRKFSSLPSVRSEPILSTRKMEEPTLPPLKPASDDEREEALAAPLPVSTPMQVVATPFSTTATTAVRTTVPQQTAQEATLTLTAPMPNSQQNEDGKMVQMSRAAPASPTSTDSMDNSSPIEDFKTAFSKKKVARPQTHFQHTFATSIVPMPSTGLYRAPIPRAPAAYTFS